MITTQCMSVIIIALLIIVEITNAHKCIHDQVINTPRAMRERSQRSMVNYGKKNPFSRNIEEKANIRIHLIKKYTTLSSTEQTFLNDKVLPRAVEKLSKLLLVTPVTGNLQLDRQCKSGCSPNPREKCTSYSAATCGNYGAVPDNLFKDTEKYDSCGSFASSETIQGGAGVANSDLIIFVTDSQEDCGSSTLAFAAACFQDQNDRPVAGHINFCSADVTNEDKVVDTAVHEITHVLGISSSLFGYYRNPSTGEPLTERNAFGQPVQDGKFVINENTVKSYKRSSDGKTVTKIVTPQVVSKTVEYYGCNEADGIELENFGGKGSAGSHIEGRAAYAELMTSTSAPDAKFSVLSLAILESSSWYTINYTAADPYPFGFKKGCSFLNDKCLTLSNGVTTTNFETSWCKDSQRKGCTSDVLSIGKCTIFEYEASIDSAYRYFSNAQYGGYGYMDYCPVYNQETSCRDSSNVPSSNTRSEVYGSTSKCIINTLSTSIGASSEDGGCYTVECPPRTATAPKNATITFSNGNSVVCTDADGGTKKSVSGLNGQFTCPNILAICPPLVSNECICVNGQCQDGICQCDAGYTGSTCARKSSATSLAMSFSVLMIILAATFML